VRRVLKVGIYPPGLFGFVSACHVPYFQDFVNLFTPVMEGHPEVVVSSFAFKTGPPDANLVLDVRFLPDPRPLMEQIPALDGTHDAVEEFITTRSCFDQFFEVLKGQIVSVVTDLRSRGCHRVEFAFGCTGGQHRSVFVAERLAGWLREYTGQDDKIVVLHRELSPRSSTDFGPVFELPTMAICHSPASSSSCDSPASSRSSSSNSSGPSFKCTYHPDSNLIHIEECAPIRPTLSTDDMNSMLGSGLDRVKALRERRRKSSLATNSM